MTIVALAPKAEAKARVASPSGKRAWIIGAVLLALVAAGLVWRHGHAAPPAHYLSAPAAFGDIASAAAATGTVNPELTIIVGSYVSGVLMQISCDYNTKVSTGQICAKIDPRP